MAILHRLPRLTTHSAISHVIAHAPFGVARISPDMRFKVVNARLSSLLGAAPRAMIGADVADVVPTDDRVVVLRRLRSIVNGVDETVEFELDTLRTDGTSTWLRWSVTASRGSDGTVDDLVATFEDATATHKADDAAAAHLAALERLTFLINGFAAMVSHETRTALTGIQGMSELILEGDTDASEVHEYANCIFKESGRLNRLLGEMLELNQIQTRPTRLRSEPVDFNWLVQEAVERMGFSEGDHQIALDLATVPLVVGDPDRLNQVIENLIRFAARCAEKRSVLEVSTNQRDSAVIASFRYMSNGQSIDFENWLYGRYEPYEKNPSLITGAGLGLAIARVIVERHGGEIWMDGTSPARRELCLSIPTRTEPVLVAS